MHYRDRLLNQKLSSKTLKDCIAVNRQFFNWCLAHELITVNPFAFVKTSSENAKSDQEQRQRWKTGIYKPYSQETLIAKKIQTLNG